MATNPKYDIFILSYIDEDCKMRIWSSYFNNELGKAVANSLLREVPGAGVGCSS